MLHVRCALQYISLPWSAKRQHDISNFKGFHDNVNAHHEITLNGVPTGCLEAYLVNYIEYEQEQSPSSHCCTSVYFQVKVSLPDIFAAENLFCPLFVCYRSISVNTKGRFSRSEPHFTDFSLYTGWEGCEHKDRSPPSCYLEGWCNLVVVFSCRAYFS